MFGSHLSTAGGLHNALLDAKRLRCECVQVFTRNQRQWTPPALAREQIDAWADQRRQTPVAAVVSHDSYLINLCSPNKLVLRRSLAAFRDELLRCAALDIPLLVTHPGSHLGQGEEAGLRLVARSLDQVHADLPGLKVVTCLEITAGQGTGLGHRFEHLRQIMDLVREPERLAVCLDTAHLLAAGYDLTSADGCRATVQECAAVLGLERVRVMHLNDSKTPRGSRVDRHEHIGRGHVAPAAFRVLVTHPAFRAVPKILETPKGQAPDGQDWDRINLRKLRAWARR